MALLALGVVLILTFLNKVFSPAIQTLSTLECRALASSTVNGSLLDTLARERITYEDLTVISTNETGLVTSVSADVVRLNQLKAAVGAEIDQRMAGLQSRDLYLPLGSLLGLDYLSGMGPVYHTNFSLYGESFITFDSSFDAVGVNQTRHRILLTVETKIFMFLPSSKEVLTFETQVCAAETIIVGAVPSAQWQGFAPSADE